ncbi:tetratricopeptide repeat protein [Planococcus sp. 1R117A]|uniref:tetratricopeptide repeat protein n=1 Tax=Planococcus sp. 1R117A TaxID=3447020 RepID=UPI003EDC09EC
MLIIIFIGMSIGSYWLIFSQGLVLGILISLVLLALCIAVLAFSLYGIEIGQLKKIRLTSRMQVASLLILTVYLSSAIGLFAVANTLLEAKELTGNFTAAEKTQTLASSLWNSSTNQDLSGTMEKNDVTYSYTSSTKGEISKIDEFLEREKGRIADFFGNEDTGNLTIVFHDDFDTLAEATGHDEARGYYDYSTQEIHMVPDDYSWDIILLHEYSHHQSHLYSETHRLAETRLPSWFEEGTADYLAGESSDWYELEDVETVDFHLLDYNYSFHDTYTRKYDPYIQSFLAVESLVNEHGEDVLKTFLPAKLPSEFYEMLEETTGMTLGDFQKTFLDDVVEESKTEQEKYNAAYEAMEKGNYAEAAGIIDELSALASDEDLSQLAWMQTDLYLMQGQFNEAIKFMERHLENGDPEYRIDDLTTLAEIYVLINPEKSLELIKTAAEESSEDEDMYDLEAYLEAYELISSSSPYEGYMILLDEELIYNETIIKQLTEKVEKEFPEAS